MQTQDGAIVSKLLTDVSNGYFPTGFIADQILPKKYVPQTTGKIGKYNNNHLRLVTTIHTGKGPYRQLEAVQVSSDSYEIDDHGLHDIITKKDMVNFEDPFDAEVDSALALKLALMIGKEYALAAALQSTSIITQTSTLTGTQRYNNIEHADSQPIQDSITAHNAIRDATGMRANVVIMNGKVYDYMSRHKQLLGALGYTRTPEGGLPTDALARVLNVEKVLVGEAMYNNAKEGQADNLTNIWGNDLVYARIGAPSLRQKVLGFEMRLIGQQPYEVATYTPTMPLKSKGIIVADGYDQLLLNTTCAYLFKTVIS